MEPNGGGDTGSNILQPGQQICPIINSDVANELVRKLYGVKVKEIHELNAYDDKNFHILVNDIDNPYISRVHSYGYVFKIMNSLDSKNLLLIDGQKEIMFYLAKHHVMCPKPVPNIHNAYYSIEELNKAGDSGNQVCSKHVVRLLEYQPGTLLCHVPSNRELFFDAGKYLANLDQILKDFCHEVYASHKSVWNLSYVPDLKKFLFAVENPENRNLASQVIESFKNEVVPRMDSFEQGILHGDFNEQNVLCAKLPDGEWQVAGILDFGDSHFSCYVFELAVAVCYMMLQCKDMDPLEASGYFIAGYSAIRQLPKEEIGILKTCIAARYAQSLVLGAYSYSLNPNNDYVMITAKLGWKQLKYLWSTPQESIYSTWETIMEKCKNTPITR